MIKMSAFEFIKTELIDFIQKFQKTRVKVERDMDLNSYYLEIIPSEIYHFNDSYISWEKYFLNKFIVEFPDENLFFITDDSVITLENVCFELTGSDFNQYVNVNPVIIPTDPKITVYSNHELNQIPTLNLHPHSNFANYTINLISNSAAIPVNEIEYFGKNINKKTDTVSDKFYTSAA
jgi:hypothetical protein